MNTEVNIHNKWCLILILLNLVFGNVLNAQLENSRWYFGKDIGLGFTDSGVVQLMDANISIHGSGATLSDGEGNLLFYSGSDSIPYHLSGKNFIKNHQHQIIDNSLSRGTTSVIASIPNSNGKFILFCLVDFNDNHGGRFIEYNYIDLLAEDGSGKVTRKNEILSTTDTVYDIITVPHQNKKDTWVLALIKPNYASQYQYNRINAYLVTETGLNTTPTVSFINIKSPPGYHLGQIYRGRKDQINVSPDGKNIVLAVDTGLILANFDPTNGKITNQQLINNQRVISMEFSHDSRFLYTDMENGSKDIAYINTDTFALIQYDLQFPQIDSINNSAVCLQYRIKNVAYESIHDLYRGIDGKIYFWHWRELRIGCIEKPYLKGNNCELNLNYINGIKPSNYSTKAFPRRINPYFPFIFFQYSFPDTCGFEADFVLNDSINTAQWTWDFGDGSAPIIGVKRPKHTFSQPGIYSVKLKYTLKNGYADSVIREVRIQGFAPHYGFAERNLVACLGDTLTLKASWPADNYLWQNGETQPEITVTNNGTYHLATQAGNCVLSDSVEVSFKPKPTVYLGNDSTFCGRVSHTFDPVTNASRFKWNTGDTTRTLAVNEHGQYSLRVETEENCHNADTVLLFLETYPTAPFHSDTVVCGDIALLNAGNPNCTMLWNTGEQTQEIQVSTSGLYWVKIENEHCAIIDSINLTLIEFCDYHVHIPNTFTPNADGLNDCFSPTFINITSIDLKIYSRWGELIYQTDNKNDCWDGKHKGEACPAEVYFYTLQYQYETPFKTGLGNDKGMIHLVR